LAEQARQYLPDSTYPAKMYDFVKAAYDSGIPWEETRDRVYQRYQVEQMDGYELTSRDLYCNGCYAAGINFAASLVSLFYGEGDLNETIKIGALTGWDSDNPTATWGGLLGFMLGKDGVENAFGRKFSEQYNIHRTRQNFPNDGIDTFDHMADTGIAIIDMVVSNMMGGTAENDSDSWKLPADAVIPK
ncbi:MAG: ADP-ribosylglycohydrolase family protein, partial [Cyclobacteriaceae bacterium]